MAFSIFLQTELIVYLFILKTANLREEAVCQLYKSSNGIFNFPPTESCIVYLFYYKYYWNLYQPSGAADNTTARK